MKHVIYRAHPIKNKNKTLYVGRTCQDLEYYVNKRNRECFISNPSSRRPLFIFMRKKYKNIQGVRENVTWEVIENVHSNVHVQRREQYWINKLNPILNARNELLLL